VGVSLQLLQGRFAVSSCFKPAETDKSFILLDKSPSVSLFHRFQGEAAGNFQIGVKQTRH